MKGDVVSDLVEFLRARWDEDERVARVAAAANPGSAAIHWSAERVDYLSSTGVRGTAWAVIPERVKGVTIAIVPTDIQPRFVAHIARHDPARVLADIEAKRRMVDELLALPHYAWEGRGEYGCPKATDAETWADVMGAEQTCTCGRDVHVERMLRLLALPYAADYDEAWRP